MTLPAIERGASAAASSFRDLALTAFPTPTDEEVSQAGAEGLYARLLSLPPERILPFLQRLVRTSQLPTLSAWVEQELAHQPNAHQRVSHRRAEQVHRQQLVILREVIAALTQAPSESPILHREQPLNLQQLIALLAFHIERQVVAEFDSSAPAVPLGQQGMWREHTMPMISLDEEIPPEEEEPLVQAMRLLRAEAMDRVGAAARRHFAYRQQALGLFPRDGLPPREQVDTLRALVQMVYTYAIAFGVDPRAGAARPRQLHGEPPADPVAFQAWMGRLRSLSVHHVAVDHVFAQYGRLLYLVQQAAPVAMPEAEEFRLAMSELEKSLGAALREFHAGAMIAAGLHGSRSEGDGQATDQHGLVWTEEVLGRVLARFHAAETQVEAVSRQLQAVIEGLQPMIGKAGMSEMQAEFAAPYDAMQGLARELYEALRPREGSEDAAASLPATSENDPVPAAIVATSLVRMQGGDPLPVDEKGRREAQLSHLFSALAIDDYAVLAGPAGLPVPLAGDLRRLAH